MSIEDPNVDLNTFLAGLRDEFKEVKGELKANTAMTRQMHTALAGYNGKGGLISQVTRNTKAIAILAILLGSLVGADKLVGLF